MELSTSQQPGQENDKNDDAFVKVEQSGVKRKLFQEDGTENNEGFQEYSAADTCGQSSQNWEKDAKENGKRENKIFGKEKKGDMAILLISSCKNACLMRLIEDQAMFYCDNPEVNHCFPDTACRIASVKTFVLIIIDLNVDYVDSLLKISLAIRSSAYANQATPIVALKHAVSYKISEELWKKYGISEIVYGPLYQSTIERICERYLNQVAKRDLPGEDKCPKNSNLTSSAKQDDLRASMSKTIEANGPKSIWNSGRIGSPIPACDSTDQLTPYCESGSSDVNIQVQLDEETRYVDEKSPSVQTCSAYLTTGQNSYATNCVAPLSVSANGRQAASDCPMNNSYSTNQADTNGPKSNSAGWNVIQQILDLHQNAQKDIEHKSKSTTQSAETSSVQTVKPVMSQQSIGIYPLVSQNASVIRSYPAHSLFTAPALTQNAGYMINGTPGTSSMKLSLIPDEYTKHSNKERERRERIKDSCDELRKILPKQLLSGRRQDMATVLEMTVYYLKVVQDHIPAVIHQQLYQNFVTYNDWKTRRKRKGPEITPAMPSMLQTKYQRMPATTTITTASNGCYNGNYTNPYMSQMIPTTTYQQSNFGYFSSMYHSLVPNPYHTPATQTVYGSASLPSLDHVMHLRSQYYNEAVPSQNGIPCYIAVTSSSRDIGNSSLQRTDAGKSQFIG
ncbi:uncharacterized protein LOC135693736 [Rhopilema esculentum]|uniref:uncharacterized protein LOC135693736 n=1 Tax=Rhopilema esculentum TaxID=499914 RepID=UPI0031DB53BE